MRHDGAWHASRALDEERGACVRERTETMAKKKATDVEFDPETGEVLEDDAVHEDLSHAELKRIAKEMGIKGYSKMSRGELSLRIVNGGEEPIDASKLTAEQKTALADEKAHEIAKLYAELDAAKDELYAARTSWNTKVKDAREGLANTIKMGSPEIDAVNRLNGIKEAFQHLEEMEAGRTEVVAPLAEAVSKLDVRLKRLLQQCNQLDLRF